MNQTSGCLMVGGRNVISRIVTGTVIFSVLSYLLTCGGIYAMETLGISTYSNDDLLQHIWTLVTYMFVCNGLFSLFATAIALFVFGGIAMTMFSSRQLGTLYVFSGIIAGLIFFFAGRLLPYDTTICGAAGALAGMMTAMAVYAPDKMLTVPFVGSARMIWVALTALVLLTLYHSDSGAFLILISGGAIGGYIFAVALKNGTDFSKPVSYCIDKTTAFFTSKKKQHEENNRTTFHYAENVVNNSVDDLTDEKETDATEQQENRPDEQEVERILAKIRTSGYSSLTEDEKRTIFN